MIVQKIEGKNTYLIIFECMYLFYIPSQFMQDFNT